MSEELGEPYVFICTALEDNSAYRACGADAVTPCERDGNAFCEKHKDQADPENVYTSQRGDDKYEDD